MKRGMMGLLLLVSAGYGLAGCGSSAPPMSKDEMKAKEAAHSAIVQKEAEKYKGGPPAGHSGAPSPNKAHNAK
jgi:hypothetical protein